MNGKPRGVGVRDVVWFNYPMYAAALLVIGAGAAALVTGLVPTQLTVVVVLGIAGAGWWVVASIVASAWVFNLSGVTRWTWILDTLGRPPGTWLNITSGFDDTTQRLRLAIPSARGAAVDVFDSHGDHDGALRRARNAFPPARLSVRPGERLPVDDGSQDAIFLLMSAHELERGQTRDAQFADIVRALRAGGRLVVVEFVGDRITAAVFGPGVSHFESAGTWRAVAAHVGLRRVDERRLAFFARAFVFEKPAT